MTTFTIDNDNNITAFATPEEAAATTATPFDSFASQQELAELVAGWPPERLVAIWNSLPGVTPVKRFKSVEAAAGRIWERIQHLGSPETSEADEPEPKAERKAKGGAQAAKGAPRRAFSLVRDQPNRVSFRSAHAVWPTGSAASSRSRFR